MLKRISLKQSTRIAIQYTADHDSMPRLITDFDGPIVDVSERYYQVYQYCLASVADPEQSLQPLTKVEFWSLKRSRIPEMQIGINSGLEFSQARDFAQLRRDTIHTMPYFQHDLIIPGARSALQKLQAAGIELVVMTMRRTRELNFALSNYELDEFFHPDRRYCLDNDYLKTQDIEDKTLLMQRAMQELAAEQTWMLGDTEADIIAAQSQGLPAIAVLSGIRDRTQLAAYNPDFILTDLLAATDLILEQTLMSSSS